MQVSSLGDRLAFQPMGSLLFFILHLWSATPMAHSVRYEGTLTYLELLTRQFVWNAKKKQEKYFTMSSAEICTQYALLWIYHVLLLHVDMLLCFYLLFTVTCLHPVLFLNPFHSYTFVLFLCYYYNNPKYWDRHAWTNSVDPDQMLQNAASDQGLHCLLLIQQYCAHINR